MTADEVNLLNAFIHTVQNFFLLLHLFFFEHVQFEEVEVRMIYMYSKSGLGRLKQYHQHLWKISVCFFDSYIAFAFVEEDQMAEGAR